MVIKKSKILELLAFVAILTSVGRFDPKFIPIEVGSLTSNQLILYMVMLFLAVLVVFQYKKIRLSIFLVSTMALALWALISSYWSLDSSISYLKGVSFLIVATGVLGLAIHVDETAIIKAGVHASLLLLAVSIVLAVALPYSAGTTMFHEGAWRGIFMQKNVLGRAAFIGIVFSVIAIITINDRKFNITALANIFLAILVLINARSSTAWVATIIVPISICVAYKFLEFSKHQRIIVYALMPAIVIIFTLLSPLAMDLILEYTGKSADLTGRVPLWVYSLEKIEQRPLLGYGLDSFWTSSYLIEFASGAGWTPEHSHNGIIDLTLELGLVGLFLFSISLFWVLASIPLPNIDRKSLSVISVSVIICLTFLNLTESNLYRSSNTFYILYLYIGYRMMMRSNYRLN